MERSVDSAAGGGKRQDSASHTLVHPRCCPCIPTSRPGSYRYMAPEVFRHEPYNSRVDVYSFSMIVYQLFEVRCCWPGAPCR